MSKARHDLMKKNVNHQEKNQIVQPHLYNINNFIEPNSVLLKGKQENSYSRQSIIKTIQHKV